MKWKVVQMPLNRKNSRKKANENIDNFEEKFSFSSLPAFP